MLTEIRATTTDIECRDSTDGSGNYVVRGQALSYGIPATIRDAIGEFKETLHRGCLDRADMTRTVLNLNHGKGGGVPLARVPHTLQLTDTPEGLKFRADIDGDSPSGADLRSALRRKVLSEMSFAFTVDPSGDQWSKGDTVRDIRGISSLHDVSIVTDPAYPVGTSVDIAARAVARLDDASRVRLQRAASIASDLRAGKVVSAANKALLAQALEHLSAATAHVTSVHQANEHTDGRGRNPGPVRNCPTCFGSCVDGFTSCKTCDGKGVVPMDFVGGADGTQAGGSGPGNPTSGLFPIGDGSGTRAAWELELATRARAIEEQRAADKYNADQLRKLLKQGKALDAGDRIAFPIADAEDVKNAVTALPLTKLSKSRVRAHIVKNAATLGCLHLVPKAWS